MATETMSCPRCKGRGTVPLDPSLQETLDWLRANGDSTAQQIWQQWQELGRNKEIGVTAVNNRLKKLHDLKWISRRKVNKEWVYINLPF